MMMPCGVAFWLSGAVAWNGLVTMIRFLSRMKYPSAVIDRLSIGRNVRPALAFCEVSCLSAGIPNTLWVIGSALLVVLIWLGVSTPVTGSGMNTVDVLLNH